MRIFKPLGGDDYELAQPIADDDVFLLAEQLNGLPRRDTWKPIRMQVVTEEWDGQPFLESDAPWSGAHALIFRPRAVEVMAPLLEPHGEFLPLACEKTELVVFNCTRVVNALDEDASELWRFEDDRRISRIVRHVFRPELIRGLPAFRITSLDFSPTYVGEDFVARWNEAGLRGLSFPLVWEG